MPEIIDVHIHITPPEIIEKQDEYCARDDYFNLLCSNPKNEFVTREDLVNNMSNLGLHKAVIFGFAFADNNLCKKVNDYTIETIEQHPDKFIGFCVVNPTGSNLKAELERCYENGMQGIGEIFPAGQDFDITSKRDMKEICKFAAEVDWPILLHVNEPVGHYYAGKTEISMKEGLKLAQNFPENKFIFAHWGGGLPFFELMPEVEDDLTNVYYDTAASPFLYRDKIFSVVKSIGVIDKILLGSDYPLLSPKLYREKISETELSKDEQEKILYKNAENLLLN